MHLFSWRALLKVELLCFLQNLHKTIARSSPWLLAEVNFVSVPFTYLDTMMSKLAWLILSVASGHMTPEDSAQCGNETGSLLQTAQRNPFLSLAQLQGQAGATWESCCRVLKYLKYASKLKMIFDGCSVAIATCVKSRCFLLQLQACVCTDSF